MCLCSEKTVVHQFLILFLLLTPILAEWNTRDYIRREHSLTKPYQGSGMSVPYWDFLGSTIVTSNYVRLTPDLQSKGGAIWNTVPCYTRNWEIQIQFKVHGSGKDLFGDGLALWYVRDRMQPGPVFGSKDYFQGLSIILDTYSNHNGAHNHQHPYISAMISNGTLHYDHDRDGTHTQIAGCEAKFRNYNHDTHLSIIYKDDTLKEHSYQDIIMYECFLEIAFEAELSTKEDPELLELAPELCNEDAATRATAITELRNMIFERGECKPHRTDDAYLLRFLRARDFIVRRAHKLLVRYYTFRADYPHLYQDVDLWGLMKVKSTYEGTMLDRPDVGRLSIFRFGTWDPNEFPVDDLVRTGVAIMEIGIRQPKIQILGGTVLVDLEGLSLRQTASLTPTIAYQIVCLMGVVTPGRLKSVHIINYSWILNTFFYIFKRFIPQQAWSRIIFHGSDLKSLHRHIDPECLPARYGGTCRNHVPIGIWLQKIKKYRDEQFDKEMKDLGYVVKE